MAAQRHAGRRGIGVPLRHAGIPAPARPGARSRNRGMAALRRPGMRNDLLLPCVLGLAAATLVHHAHNAEFLDQYPNMPAWLSPAGVYAAWSIAAAVGAAGYFLLRRGYRLAGIVLLILYAAYGLDGLVHYALAPAAAHTPDRKSVV